MVISPRYREEISHNSLLNVLTPSQLEPPLCTSLTREHIIWLWLLLTEGEIRCRNCHVLSPFLSPWVEVFFFPFLTTWWHFWLCVKWNFLQIWQIEETLKLFPLTLCFSFWALNRKCPNSASSFPPTASLICHWVHVASLFALPISQMFWVYFCSSNKQKSNKAAYLPLEFWGWHPVLWIRKTKFGDNFEPLFSVFGLLKAMITLQKDNTVSD